MKDIRFANRPNPCHVLADGREVWESRSVAVVGTVIVRRGDTKHVALVRRGPALPDEVGKLCLPCGYLDWDETAQEAVRREIYEEAGLDVADPVVWQSEPQPWYVYSDPLGKQNVTLHYWFHAELAELPPLSARQAEPGEVSELGWLPLCEATERQLAFGHHEILLRFQRARRI